MSIDTKKEQKPKTSLRKIIAFSSLSEAQQDMWSVFIDVATENEITPIIDAVVNDMPVLVFLTENMEKKMHIVATKDASAWQKIVKEEKEYLSKVSN